MNSPELPPDSEPIPFEWLFRRITLLRVLLALALFSGLVMAFYAIENWRGERALARLEQDMRTQGRPASLAEATPPPVPDDQNFALTPLLRPSLDYTRVTNGITSSIRWNDAIHRNHQELVTYSRGPYGGKEPGRAKWSAGQRVNLKAWQDYYRTPARQVSPTVRPARILPAEVNERYGLPPGAAADARAELPAFPVAEPAQSPAEDVLLALSYVGLDLDHLEAEARARPLTRFPVHYYEKPAYGILLPHLSLLKRLTLLAQLRACARLATNQPNEAFEDVLFAFRLGEAMVSEPLAVSHLVRLVCWTEALQPVWEGLVDHRWQETHLAAFEKILRGIDLLAGHEKSLTGEQWLMPPVPVGFAGRKELAAAFSEFNTRGEEQVGVDPRFAVYLFLGPRGWFLQNHARRARALQERMDHFQRLAGTPQATNFALPAATERGFRYRATPYSFIAGRIDMSGSMWRTNAVRTLHGQTDINLARVAIALERSRLAQGAVAEHLAALVPAFLDRVPPDLMDGKPLHYERQSDEKFLLYSIGVNGQDDGGTPPAKEEGFDGDWCWPSTTKPPPIGLEKSRRDE